MNETPWMHYVRWIVGRESDTRIAERLGISPSTVGRWRSGAVDPKPRQVVAFAREYGVSPVGALIAAGYLTEDELDMDPDRSTLSRFTTFEISRELNSRLGQIASFMSGLADDRQDFGFSGWAARYLDPGTAPATANPDETLDRLLGGKKRVVNGWIVPAKSNAEEWPSTQLSPSESRSNYIRADERAKPYAVGGLEPATEDE